MSSSENGSGAAEHFDVLIVGAGMSGVGIAVYLQRSLPAKRFAILEGRDRVGGTWDLFRYPGIRSDSDIATFGFDFKPWDDDEIIAQGPRIRQYIQEAAAENGIEEKIRFARKVTGASWSTADGVWTVSVSRADGGEDEVYTCNWLYGACGYYRYDRGYSPEFEGSERFRGEIVHPQQWPEDLDYSGKRVVVIGSGATAVTLVPSMCAEAEHVTMLQRSPSYIFSIPETDVLTSAVRKVLGAEQAHRFARRKNIALQRAIFRTARRRPEVIKRLLRLQQRRRLPKDFDWAHLTPAYEPWDQRLCMVPRGDLFDAISSGQASIATDRIETFTEDGIELASGRKLEADIIVTATGLIMHPLGGIALEVDGEPISLPDTVTYKGTMLSGAPNFAFAIGYTNISWTLKVNLLGTWFTRLLRHMEATGVHQCVPVVGDEVERQPLVDLSSGYIQRAIDSFPRKGDRGPWQVTMDYVSDVPIFTEEPLEDGALRFSRTAAGEAGIMRRYLNPEVRAAISRLHRTLRRFKSQ